MLKSTVISGKWLRGRKIILYVSSQKTASQTQGGEIAVERAARGGKDVMD